MYRSDRVTTANASSVNAALSLLMTCELSVNISRYIGLVIRASIAYRSEVQSGREVSSEIREIDVHMP